MKQNNIKKYSHLPLENVKIKKGFWKEYQTLVAKTVIPFQEEILHDRVENAEPSHAIMNFKIAAGDEKGEFGGMVFQDSDVAKWLEAVAYSLACYEDKELEQRADEIIDIIARAQQEDGYLDTFFIIKEPEHRWHSLKDCHELYCMGHMIEASVAYYSVTGKEKILTVAKKMADHIYDRFLAQKVEGIPGHQEIELALLRLAKLTGDERYTELAQLFLDRRGKKPDYFDEEIKKGRFLYWTKEGGDYNYAQNHLPVREQSAATGHSVRAMYMYTAMADLAGMTGEKELKAACNRLWDNITEKQMYVTGGIGSIGDREAFTFDYDLPNDSAYNETCASIGLVFFAEKMLQMQVDRKFSDVIETAIYNGIISGMEQDGKHFFYVNPLEAVPKVSGELFGYRHDLIKRPEWYGCACCPPNLSRLVMSFGKYAWGVDENQDIIYSHQYFSGETTFDLGNNNVKITTATDYPSDGNISYKISTAKPVEMTLSVRVPGWCEDWQVYVNGEEKTDYTLDKGYAYIAREYCDGDEVQLVLKMEPRRIYSNTNVRYNAGCVALALGPIVYAFEQVDNGQNLSAIQISPDAQITVKQGNDGTFAGKNLLCLKGTRNISSNQLYSTEPPKKVQQDLLAIPYYLWANRGEGEMRVWMHSQ